MQRQRRRRQLEELLTAVFPTVLSTVPYHLPMQQHWKLEMLPPVVMRHSSVQEEKLI
jgi:hypothetical protein